MKALSEFPKLYLYTVPLDFRRGLDHMVALVVEATGRTFFTGELFAFVNRRKDKLRAIYWDETGYAVWMKRLDKETFRWPRRDARSLAVSTDEMRLVLAGFDLDKMKGHEKLTYERHF